MRKPNPLPILTRECGVKLGAIRDALTRGIELEELHSLALRPTIEDDRDYRALFHLTMSEWGINPTPHIRRSLWNCYFPETRPHIFHVLVYRLQVPISTLSLQSKLSERMIQNDLRSSRIYKGHLQAVAPYATLLYESMASPRTWDGYDSRSMEIYRSLRDPHRIKPYGVLLQD